MKESREKKVSEDNIRSYSSIISLTNNTLKAPKSSKSFNKYEKTSKIKDKVLSALIALGLIGGSIGIFILIDFIVNINHGL